MEGKNKYIHIFLKKFIKNNFCKLSIIIFIFYEILYINFNYNNYYNSNQIILDTNIGNNQGYHPKVISFPEMWNGYKYWIAYTPYPNANCKKENPTINASNDLIKWITPKGSYNPLDIPKIPNEFHYNSDTHLLYNPDNNELEVFWRYVDAEKNNVFIYKKRTRNGVRWSKRIIFLKSEDRKEQDYLSPSIIYENGIYKIWFVNNKRIYYIEKKLNVLNNSRIINIIYKNQYNPWHIDVIYNKNKKLYELISCAYIDIKQYHEMSLYYTASKDNVNWEIPFIILRPSKINTKWDSLGLYRSCLLYEKGIYYLFYSGHDKDRNAGIGLMYGKNIRHLKPYI